MNEKVKSKLNKISLLGGRITYQNEWILIYTYDNGNTLGYINLVTGYLADTIYTRISYFGDDIAVLTFVEDRKRYTTATTRYYNKEIFDRQSLSANSNIITHVNGLMYAISIEKKCTTLANIYGDKIVFSNTNSVYIEANQLESELFYSVTLKWIDYNYKAMFIEKFNAIKLDRHLNLM